MNQTPFDPATFASSFQGFMESMRQAAPEEQPGLLLKMRDHFGVDPTRLPILSEDFDGHDHPNLHLAVEAVLNRGGRSYESLGVSEEYPGSGVTLNDVVSRGPRAAVESPIEYVNFHRDDRTVLQCTQNALFLISDGDNRMALLFRGPVHERYDDRIRIQVMAPERTQAQQLLSEIRMEMYRLNVYCGKILSVRANYYGRGFKLAFHRFPTIPRENIILPEGVLERVERLTVRFGEHRERLRAAQRHLKRGILLHGPPGTGKTLTAMHLATRMTDRTTLLLTGYGFRALGTACDLARALQPSMIILEDVDLIAEDRNHADQCSQPLLFELLNEMEGLGEDCDVIFLLTTNRPERLEKALAARPGRIDQAVEIPAPDDACRRRLIDLYSNGLSFGDSVDIDKLIERTGGVSAAFIRELLRKAALFASDEETVRKNHQEQLHIEDRHLDAAIHELLVVGGELTRSLLGVQSDTNE